MIRSCSRRAVLQTGVSVGVGGLAGCIGTEEATPADANGGDDEATTSSPDGHTQTGPEDASWPMFHHGARNRGFIPGENGPTAGVAERWQFETGGSFDTAPAVVDGTVYAGNQDGGVYAVDAADGTEHWRYSTPSACNSSPAVVDDTVYVGSDSSACYALDAGDGSERWQFDTESWVLSSPTVADDTVYVGDYSGHVYALASGDGAKRWEGYPGGSIKTAPAVADGTVYVGSDSAVYALDGSNGEKKWRFIATEIDHPHITSPAVAAGTIYVGTKKFVYAIDAEDGTKQWEFGTSDYAWAPTVGEGSVYVGSWDGNVYALNASDGTEQWRFETGAPIDSAPVLAGNTLFVGSGRIYGIDASDGTELWQFATGEDPSADRWANDSGRANWSPVVVDGTVYVGGNDGNLYALTE